MSVPFFNNYTANIDMKIYTKTGDKGSTSLFNGARVSKNALRVNCYGTIDEMNSIVGLAITFSPENDLKSDLIALSLTLFNLGSDLATPLIPTPKFEPPRMTEEDIQKLETLIDRYTELLPPLKSFILPGGSQTAAFLHQARTVCRRAERLMVELSASEQLSEFTMIFVNRLSDYLFTAARYSNYLQNIEDIKWETK